MIHKKRTGRSLRITKQLVENDDFYEEVDELYSERRRQLFQALGLSVDLSISHGLERMALRVASRDLSKTMGLKMKESKNESLLVNMACNPSMDRKAEVPNGYVPTLPSQPIPRSQSLKEFNNINSNGRHVRSCPTNISDSSRLSENHIPALCVPRQVPTKLSEHTPSHNGSPAAPSQKIDTDMAQASRSAVPTDSRYCHGNINPQFDERYYLAPQASPPPDSTPSHANIMLTTVKTSPPDLMNYHDICAVSAPCLLCMTPVDMQTNLESIEADQESRVDMDPEYAEFSQFAMKLGNFFCVCGCGQHQTSLS